MPHAARFFVFRRGFPQLPRGPHVGRSLLLLSEAVQIIHIHTPSSVKAFPLYVLPLYHVLGGKTHFGPAIMQNLNLLRLWCVKNKNPESAAFHAGSKRPCAINQACLIWSNKLRLLIYLTAQLLTGIKSTVWIFLLSRFCLKKTKERPFFVQTPTGLVAALQ